MQPRGQKTQCRGNVSAYSLVQKVILMILALKVTMEMRPGRKWDHTLIQGANVIRFWNLARHPRNKGWSAKIASWT
jgi:hypothetical protein